MEKENRYSRLIERIFSSKYQVGTQEVLFDREDMVQAASDLGIKLPKNLGDVVYSFRYRSSLPKPVRDLAPEGREWMIRPAGRGRYRFVAVRLTTIAPNPMLAETKIPNSTPGIIAMYALNDEQSLLATVRYNRLIDTFTGVTCYSLQSHLRTAVAGLGQIETDEVYVGVDRRGAHYVIPVQAKGGRDSLSIVQIEQDLAMCACKFRSLICIPVGAQFMEDSLIALFAFEESEQGVAISSERHYRLVPPEEMTDADLESYRARPLEKL